MTIQAFLWNVICLLFINRRVITKAASFASITKAAGSTSCMLPVVSSYPLTLKKALGGLETGNDNAAIDEKCCVPIGCRRGRLAFSNIVSTMT